MRELNLVLGVVDEDKPDGANGMKEHQYQPNLYPNHECEGGIGLLVSVAAVLEWRSYFLVKKRAEKKEKVRKYQHWVNRMPEATQN